MNKYIKYYIDHNKLTKFDTTNNNSLFLLNKVGYMNPKEPLRLVLCDVIGKIGKNMTLNKSLFIIDKKSSPCIFEIMNATNSTTRNSICFYI